MGAEPRLVNGDQYLALVPTGGVTLGLEWGLMVGTHATALARTDMPVAVAYYDGPRRRISYPAGFTSARVPDGGSVEAKAQWVDGEGAKWQVVAAARLAGSGFAITYQWTLLEGEARDVSLQMLTRPLASPRGTWSLIPGLLYDTNRADHVVATSYPPTASLAQQLAWHVADTPVRVTSDIPRIDAPDYTLDALTTDTATPHVGILDLDRGGAFFVGTRVGGELGFNGITYVRDLHSGNHEIAFASPGVRPRRYALCGFADSPDVAATLVAGTVVESELHVTSQPAEDPIGLLKAFRQVREGRRAGKRVPSRLPLSSACEMIIDKYDRVNWREELGYYRQGIGDLPHFHLQMGWIAGMSTVYNLLSLGGDRPRQRALRQLTFILDGGQAPSGLYYEVFDGKEWRHNATLIRRTADTIFWGLKAGGVMAEEDLDAPLRGRLDASLRSALDALVRIWRRDGDLGYIVDPETTAITWLGSCGGAIAVAALARGARRFAVPEYLDVAHELAQHYFANFIARGETYGAPGDILCATEQESCHALLDSFVTMFEETSDRRYLDHAAATANLLSSWMLTEEITYPPGTLLDRVGIHPFGAMMASVQNLVGTQGLCTSSGDSALRLYEHTGDEFYLHFLVDMIRACPQMVVTEEGQWGDLPVGSMTECLNFNDALAGRGDAYCVECTWPQEMLMMAFTELPGVYIDREARILSSLDHVEARWSGEDVVMTNPTQHPAHLRVRTRGADERWVDLAPGATVLYQARAAPALAGGARFKDDK